jgi:hypothetical protein
VGNKPGADMDTILAVVYICGAAFLLYRDCRTQGGLNWFFIFWQMLFLASLVFVSKHFLEPDSMQQFVMWIICKPNAIYFLKKFFDAKNAFISSLSELSRRFLGLPLFPSLHAYLDGLIITALIFVNIIGVVWSFANLVGKVS